MRVKLPLLEEEPGCNKCKKPGKRGPPCQICNMIEESTTFSDKDESRIFDIRKGPLDCNWDNVVYLIQYRVCKNQYCGSTVTKCRTRLNNYKSKFRKYEASFLNNTLENMTKIEQASFHDQFCQAGHSGISDWSLKLIDQADDETSLRVKESFWQHKLNTFVPNGLNEREVYIP